MIGGPKSRSLRKLRSIELSVVARDAHGSSVGYRLSRRLQKLFVFIFVCSLVLATSAVSGSPTSAQEVDNETDLNALFEGFDDLPADDSDPLAGLEADLEAGIDSPAGEGTLEELPEGGEVANRSTNGVEEATGMVRSLTAALSPLAGLGTCSPAPNTVWVSSPLTATEYFTDQFDAPDRMRPTGRSINLAVSPVEGSRAFNQWGSGIALSPDGQHLYAVRYVPSQIAFNRGDNVTIRQFSTATGLLERTIETNIRYRGNAPQSLQIGDSVNRAVLNSLSYGAPGKLYMGAENSTIVWEVDIATGASQVISVRSGTTGWGGDFVALPQGGTLGADKTGMLWYWPGRPVGTPVQVGKVRLPNRPTNTFPKEIFGLAVVDGRVYVLDGNGVSPDGTVGVYTLPVSFDPSFGSYNSTTVHQSTLVLPSQFIGSLTDNLDRGQFDLASAQESLGCPVPPKTLTIVKEEVDERGQGAVPGVGWNFAATSTRNVLSTDAITYSSRATGSTSAEGKIVFPLKLDGSSAEITVAETLKDSWKLWQRNSKNAVCTSTASGGSSTPVTVTNSGTEGFRITAQPNTDITCTVANTQLQDKFAVLKRPAIDQMP